MSIVTFLALVKCPGEEENHRGARKLFECDATAAMRNGRMNNNASLSFHEWE